MSLTASPQKGKGKAREIDPLPDVITYRHLLSNGLGTHNPLRVVALIDSDAFYAACEQIRLGLDPDVPLAVLQWQGLIAVNYPARKFGITRMMTVTEAKKKCPQLIAVHVATYREGDTEPGYNENPSPSTHKISLDHYRRESQKILKIFQSTLPPGGELERASIDEAFFDFTNPVRDTIISRFPHLSNVPDSGLDTPLPLPAPSVASWVGNLIPIHPAPEPSESEPGAEQDGVAHDPGKEEEAQTTWADYAFSIGAEMTQEIRDEVRNTLGYTTSAGIARNKVLAKLVASYKKRDQQSILRNAAIPEYLRPMPFQKIRFLGGKLGGELANEFEAKSVGDIMDITLEEMQQRFGEESLWVYNVLRGIDYTEVMDRTVVKSMLAAKSLRPQLTKSSEGLHWIQVLSTELALRLKDARELEPNLWPKTLVLHIRQANADAPRSKQRPFPFVRAFTSETISKLGEKLWKDLVGNQKEFLTGSVFHMALGFHGLDAGEAGQKSIEGFFASRQPEGSREGSVAAGVKRGREDERASGEDVVEEGSSDQTSYRCPRCGKRIAIDPAVLESSTAEFDRSDALNAIKLEHEDFHFAQDLSRGDSMSPEKKKVKGSGIGKGKKKDEAKGIAKYFGSKPK